MPADVAASLVAGLWFILLLIAVALTGRVEAEPPPQITVAWLTLGCFISAYALARLGWHLQGASGDQVAVTWPRFTLNLSSTIGLHACRMKEASALARPNPPTGCMLTIQAKNTT
jgi:hypothetical protein